MCLFLKYLSFWLSVYCVRHTHPYSLLYTQPWLAHRRARGTRRRETAPRARFLMKRGVIIKYGNTQQRNNRTERRDETEETVCLPQRASAFACRRPMSPRSDALRASSVHDSTCTWGEEPRGPGAVKHTHTLTVAAQDHVAQSQATPRKNGHVRHHSPAEKCLSQM